MSKCPQSGRKGQKVDSATLKALLNTSLRHINDTQYYFCDDSQCDTVYFSEDGQQQFTTDNLDIKVYQKSPNDDDSPICYCFRHTVADVKQAVHEQTHKQILSDIEIGIKEGQCACDWRNPQGVCCLGNVRSLIKVSQINESPET